jgi:hypothetical protein
MRTNFHFEPLILFADPNPLPGKLVQDEQKKAKLFETETLFQ